MENLENMEQTTSAENAVPNETPAIVAPAKPSKRSWKNVVIIVLSVLLIVVSVVAVMGWTKPTKSALEAIQDGIKKENSSSNVSYAMKSIRNIFAGFEFDDYSINVFSESDDDFVVVLALSNVEAPAVNKEAAALVDKLYELITVNTPFDYDITMVLLDIDTGKETYRILNGVPQ